jgi:hypothetical protein
MNLPSAYPEESGQLEFVLVVLHSAIYIDFLLNLAGCLFNMNLPSAYPEESGQLEFVLVVLHSANLKIFS